HNRQTPSIKGMGPLSGSIQACVTVRPVRVIQLLENESQFYMGLKKEVTVLAAQDGFDCQVTSLH
ncbi:hypothetical protein ACXWO4_10535, partial [Streptococcus pyogenes]